MMMTTELIPSGLVDGGLATVDLLASIATCKYIDHLPLYRIEHMRGAGQRGACLVNQPVELLRQHHCHMPAKLRCTGLMPATTRPAV